MIDFFLLRSIEIFKRKYIITLIFILLMWCYCAHLGVLHLTDPIITDWNIIIGTERNGKKETQTPSQSAEQKSNQRNRKKEKGDTIIDAETSGKKERGKVGWTKKAEILSF